MLKINLIGANAKIGQTKKTIDPGFKIGFTVGKRSWSVVLRKCGLADWLKKTPRSLEDLNDMLKGAKPLVAIDFGSHGIKLIQLEETASGLRVKKIGFEPLPQNVIVNGALMQMPDVVAALKLLVERCNAEGERTIFGVNGHSTIIKRISLPEMPPETLAAGLGWEVEQYVPFDIGEINFGADVLNPKAGMGQMEVLLVATQKVVVNDYISVMKAAGLRPVHAMSDTLALCNAFEAIHGFPKAGALALINVGAGMVNIAVVSNGVLAFSCDISMGGDLITEKIQRAIDCHNFDACELMKRRVVETVNSGSCNAQAQAVYRACDQHVETLVTEIQRAVEFWHAVSVNEPVDKAWLVGGGAKTHGLVRQLEQRLEMPVEIGSPLQELELGNLSAYESEIARTMSQEFVVALGLALSKE